MRKPPEHRQSTGDRYDTTYTQRFYDRALQHKAALITLSFLMVKWLFLTVNSALDTTLLWNNQQLMKTRFRGNYP